MNDREPEQEKPDNINLILSIVIVVVVAAAVLVYWLVFKDPEPELSDAPVEDVQVLPPPVAEPEPPVETAEPEPAPEPEPEPEPLPTLADSDDKVSELAQSLSPEGDLQSLLTSENVLLKFVRTAIAMDEGNVVKDYRPVVSPQPSFLIQLIDEPLDEEVGQRYRIDPDNYERYTVYVDTLDTLDKTRLAKLFHQYYPVLDEAYQQYGVDRGGLLNVTLGAIDEILEAPTIPGTSPLVQPKVFYQFQGEGEEQLPAASKLLYRMGPDNAARLKDNLRELKAALEEHG